MHTKPVSISPANDHEKYESCRSMWGSADLIIVLLSWNCIKIEKCRCFDWCDLNEFSKSLELLMFLKNQVEGRSCKIGPCAFFGYILNDFRNYFKITQYSVLIFKTNSIQTVESTDTLPVSTADRTDRKLRSVRNHVSHNQCLLKNLLQHAHPDE